MNSLFKTLNDICPKRDGFYLNAFANQLVKLRSLSGLRIPKTAVTGLLKLRNKAYRVSDGVADYHFTPSQVLAVAQDDSGTLIILK